MSAFVDSPLSDVDGKRGHVSHVIELMTIQRFVSPLSLCPAFRQLLSGNTQFVR